jgi:hypothetical protein
MSLRENITRHTWEPRRFLRTHGANDARRVPENRGILPENIAVCARLMSTKLECRPGRLYKILRHHVAIYEIYSSILCGVTNGLGERMSQLYPGDLAGTPVSFSPSVRRRRCSQAENDVLRQDAAVRRYAPRVIRTMCAQKPARFPGIARDVRASLQLVGLDPRHPSCGTSGSVRRRCR